ncbi:unnamed protein product, partial [Tenebrio molitor]
MKIYRTEYVTGKRIPLKFTTVLSTLKSNFDIPFSIRTEKEAHIFLCDGEDPHESNCYWFMLQAFSGSGTAIRKCSKKCIPKINNKWPQDECKKTQANISHPVFPIFLKGTQWTHYKLTKTGQTLRLLQKNGKNSRTIIEFFDKQELINVTYMIIHSKMVNALWKIHQVEFIYTNEETNKIQLGTTFSPTENYLCVSMYLLMCDSCKVKLTLLDVDSNVNVIEQDFSQLVSSEWREIKLISENKLYQYNNFKLLVSTVGGSRDQRFWAIDRVRLCQKKEFRMIGLSEKETCQLMSDDNKIITFRDSLQVSESECPENTIGEFCVPCQWIYTKCELIKNCNNDKCVCSSGYNAWNTYCYQCQNGWYGHGCKKSCGNCYYLSCNKIDGTCSPCANGFSGARCDIPPSIIFTNPPEISDVKYTEATVQVTDFTFDSTSYNEPPYAYTIQYKQQIKIQNGSNKNPNWITYDVLYPFNIPHAIVINNLKADTTYFVRGVIIISIQYQQYYYLGSHLKFKEFTTYCEEISLDNIEIKSTNITAFVSLKTRIKNTVCKLEKYLIYLHETGKRGSLDNGVVYFDGLDPFTHYTIIFQRDTEDHQKKKFQTTEGVPQQVLNLKLANKSSSTIYIKWEQPSSINGVLKHYIVTYRHVSYLACKQQPTTPSAEHTLRVTETSTTIKDLIPYSIYSICVFAENTKLKGLPSQFLIETLPAEEIESEEISGVTVTPGTYGVIIELSPNCEKIRGQLVVNTTVICTNEWCKNQNRTPKTTNHYVSNQIITLDKLTPFSDYSLDLIFCRNYTNCEGSTKRQTFRTKPTTPYAVTDLLVYTKNKSSASLRWKPPYPPTGILETYQIEHYCTHSDRHIKEFKMTSCKLWPDFHCVTVSNLKSGREYTFKVNAKNENVSKFGPTIFTNTKTKIEPSGAPYDLNITWAINNDLILQWKHPNESNGPIKYFNINLNSERKKVEKTLLITNDTYYINYNIKIDSAEVLTSTRYDVRVSAFNGFSGNYVYLMDTSPPDIPLLNGDPESGSTNDTITLKISLQKPRGQTDNRLLLILITDKNANRKITAANYSLTSSQDSIKKTIGDIYTENFFLESGTSYNVTILLLNTFQNKTRSNEYSYLYKTLGEQESNLLGLLALLLIIPIAAIIYMKRDELLSLKNDVFKRSNTSTEVVDIQEDQIPLSDVAQNNVSLPVTKKMTKPQPKTSKNPPTKSKGDSKRVKITEFEQYVKEAIVSGELERQHSLFPRGQTKPWTVGSLKENKSKNRYNNLIAYDHTRVVLEKIDGNPHSDYINANYVDGYRVPRAYIATQGPKAATLDDFWRMIWQENVQHIANLANIYEGGKKKVEKYWPEINETLQFGAIAVQHQSSQVYADYEHRVFKVTRDAESRELDQFHFSSWPDHGVPLYSQSLVPFLQKMLQIPLNTKSPIVVHCSAGVGRTGTILLCDICLRMAAREGAIDALGTLQRLREQRPNMVDNMEQYKLAHLVILECLVGMHTGIQCNEIQESVKRLLEDERTVTQMQYLEDTQWRDQAMKSEARVEEEAQVVEEKNRFKDIIPEIQGRVFITRYPTSDSTSSYINAVKVDGFRCPGRYIVTQQPMPNTLGDFWRLVEENSVSVVISLNQVNSKDKTSCAFWPTNKRPQMNPVPIISLKHVNTLSMEHYDVVTVHLSAPSRKEHFQVHIISMKNWPPKTNCPKSPEKFLAFWEEADNIARRSNPVLVTCYDGVTASGLFMAMSFVIEKMKLEQICDVCQAVRTIRHNRQQCVQNIEQFEFLYRVAVIYINGFEPYANFN